MKNTTQKTIFGLLISLALASSAMAQALSSSKPIDVKDVKFSSLFLDTSTSDQQVTITVAMDLPEGLPPDAGVCLALYPVLGVPGIIVKLRCLPMTRLADGTYQVTVVFRKYSPPDVWRIGEIYAYSELTSVTGGVTGEQIKAKGFPAEFVVGRAGVSKRKRVRIVQ